MRVARAEGQGLWFRTVGIMLLALRGGSEPMRKEMGELSTVYGMTRKERASRRKW